MVIKHVDLSNIVISVDVETFQPNKLINKQVKKIAASIAESNLLTPPVAIELHTTYATVKYLIIDGRCRILAAASLNMPSIDLQIVTLANPLEL